MKENKEDRLLKFDKTVRDYLFALEQIKNRLSASHSKEELEKDVAEMEELSSQFGSFSDMGEKYLSARKIIDKKIKEVTNLIKKIKEESEEPKTEVGYEVSMPIMVTREMTQQLLDLGWSKKEINALKPEEAHKIIAEGKVKIKTAPISPTPVVSGASYADGKGPSGEKKKEKTQNLIKELIEKEEKLREKIILVEKEIEEAKKEEEKLQKEWDSLLDKSIFNIKAEREKNKIEKELSKLHTKLNFLYKKLRELYNTETNLSKEIEEKEKEQEQKEIEEDIEKRPFAYYIAGKNSNNDHYIARTDQIDLRNIDSNLRIYDRLQPTGIPSEGYFDATISGFILIIKNVDSLRRTDVNPENGEEKKWIEYPSEEGIFKITGPSGEIIADDIQGYKKAYELYTKIAKEHEDKTREEFESLPLDETKENLKKTILEKPIVETPTTGTEKTTTIPETTPTPETGPMSVFDIEKVKAEINTKIDEEEKLNGQPFTKEERNARLFELFLEAKEDFNKKEIAEKSWLESPLKKTEALWKKLDETKKGKAIKIATSVTLIGISTYVLGNLTHVSSLSVAEIAKRVATRATGAAAVNVFLSSFFPKETLDKLGKKIKGNKGVTDEKKWKKALKNPENGFSGLGIAMSAGSAFLFGGGVAVAAVGIGGIVARRALTVYFEKMGKEEEEKMKALNDGIAQMDDLNDKLEEVENRHKEIIKKQKSLKRKKMILSSALSIGSGLATMAVADLHQPKTSSPENQAPKDTNSESQNPSGPTPGNSTPENPAPVGEPEIKLPVNEGITFENGKGGIQAILDLKAQIVKEYNGDYSKAPQSVQDFMHTDATKEAIKLGLFKPDQDAESALVGVGSTLKFDEHGNLSLHDTLTGKDSVLIRGDGSGADEYAGKMFDSDKAKTEEGIHLKETPKTFGLGNPYEKGEFHLGDKAYPDVELKTEEIKESISATAHDTEKVEELRKKIEEQINERKNTARMGTTVRTGTTMGTGFFANQGRGRGGENMFFDSRFPGMHRGMGGSHGEMFFPGLSPGENDFLNQHIRFVGENEYGLSGPDLIKTYHFFEESVEHYEKNGGSVEEWNAVRGIGAKEFLGNEVLQGEHKPIAEYLDKLQDFVKPRGWSLLRRAENIENYVARALQKLEKEDRLEEFAKSLQTKA